MCIRDSINAEYGGRGLCCHCAKPANSSSTSKMPRVWGGEDIAKEKTVFVWPSKAARDEKVDMKNLTFEPGMTEKEVKEMLLEEFNLSCTPNDITGLVDGYNQNCDKLSDIAANRKGYHVRFADERAVEFARLKIENAELKERLAAGGGSASGGDSAELKKLREENDKLRSENTKLKRELNITEGLTTRKAEPPKRSVVEDKPKSNNSSSLADQARGKARESSLSERAAKVQPRSSSNSSGSSNSRNARMERAAPEKKAPEKKAPRSQPNGAAAEAQGDRIQDLALPVPVGANQGTQNYEKLKSIWLEGCDDEPLEPPPVSYTHLTLPTKRIV
eukprot:TRINITY_DN13494_c0_g1_i2.p1 TRINITY_DN13494_c0_g1~~TRINITY_DN13494_c0_g1_i2.p1  ORF type:complete len:333 (+),score=82.10 TRINITY_DN13494_c0_g1_i2:103-1101(+)